MNILETITLRTKERIAEEKQHLPLSEVRRQRKNRNRQMFRILRRRCGRPDCPLSVR